MLPALVLLLLVPNVVDVLVHLLRERVPVVAARPEVVQIEVLLLEVLDAAAGQLQ